MVCIKNSKSCEDLQIAQKIIQRKLKFNKEIQRVIDNFTEKPNMEFIDNPEGENQNDQINTSEAQTNFFVFN